MAILELLGKEVMVSIGMSLADRAQAVSDAMTTMVTAINAAPLTDDDKRIFRLTNAVVVFDQELWRGQRISRSFMDQQARTFHWQVDEFLATSHTPETRASYYFHDCVHLDQYSRTGRAAKDLDEEVEREEEAVELQIAASRRLGCGQYFIDYLSGYEGHPDQIAERVKAGVLLAANKHCAKAGLPATFEA